MKREFFLETRGCIVLLWLICHLTSLAALAYVTPGTCELREGGKIADPALSLSSLYTLLSTLIIILNLTCPKLGYKPSFAPLKHSQQSCSTLCLPHHCERWFWMIQNQNTLLTSILTIIISLLVYYKSLVLSHFHLCPQHFVLNTQPKVILVKHKLCHMAPLVQLHISSFHPSVQKPTMGS